MNAWRAKLCKSTACWTPCPRDSAAMLIKFTDASPIQEAHHQLVRTLCHLSEARTSAPHGTTEAMRPPPQYEDCYQQAQDMPCRRDAASAFTCLAVCEHPDTQIRHGNTQLLHVASAKQADELLVGVLVDDHLRLVIR